MGEFRQFPIKFAVRGKSFRVSRGKKDNNSVATSYDVFLVHEGLLF